ncbi:hypothetical protein [Modestobacter sp. SSW1-42]|uniref:hypothetical protein n=1 Tax=Modestobacter sp. SSW1-42 TaxID=596372 RepID=UPI00398624A3
MPGIDRPRDLEVLPFPSSRRAVTAAVRAGRRIVPMHGLLEIDISEARRRLADHEPPLSMTAFVIAAVARTIAAHPEVHAYRDWRGRLVQHRHVDVQTIVELPTEQGRPSGSSTSSGTPTSATWPTSAPSCAASRRTWPPPPPGAHCSASPGWQAVSLACSRCCTR